MQDDAFAEQDEAGAPYIWRLIILIFLWNQNCQAMQVSGRGGLVVLGPLASALLQQPLQRGTDGGYSGEAAEGEHDRQVSLRLELVQELQDEQGWGVGQGG